MGRMVREIEKEGGGAEVREEEKRESKASRLIHTRNRINILAFMLQTYIQNSMKHTRLIVDKTGESQH